MGSMHIENAVARGDVEMPGNVDSSEDRIAMNKQRVLLFGWASTVAHYYPELAYMYAIQNGRSNSGAATARLAREGIKPDMPDICLPVAVAGYSALYIYLRRTGLTKYQFERMKRLEAYGNFIAVASTAEEAKEMVLSYLNGFVLAKA